jgi:hypothetical protein
MLLALLALLVEPTLLWAQSAATSGESIDQGFEEFESSDGVAVTNPNSTATGDYQDTIAFLETAGIVAPGQVVSASDFGDSNWSNITFAANPYGITSRQQLIDAPLSVQTAIENAGLTATYQQEEADGLTTYLGQTAPGGQVINQSALLACGEQLGAAGCQSFLQNGTTGNQALDDSVESEMETMSQTDSSAITGTSTTTVAEASGGSSVAGQNGSHTFMYCPPSVSATMQAASVANINAAVMLASNPTTGYSLADGSAISAGASSGSSTQPDDFGVSSCLSNLFSFQGLSFLFTTPNLTAIIQHLVGLACSYAENIKTQMLAPLNQASFANLVPSGFQPYIGQQGFGESSSYGGSGLTLGISNGSSTESVSPTISYGSAGDITSPLTAGGLIPASPTSSSSSGIQPR